MSTTVQGLILAVSATFVVAGLAVDSADEPHAAVRPTRVAPLATDAPQWEVQLDLEAAASHGSKGAAGAPFAADQPIADEASTIES